MLPVDPGCEATPGPPCEVLYRDVAWVTGPLSHDVHGGENRIADAVIAAAPDYAVVVTMDMTIHGRGNCGSPEFGGRIGQFLVERYDVVFQDIAQGGIAGQFAAVVFKRRS